MQLKFPVVLAAAALLAAAGLAPSIAPAHNAGSPHSFSRPSFQPSFNRNFHQNSHYSHKSYSSYPGNHYNHVNHHNNFPGNGNHNNNNFVQQHANFKNQVHNATFSKANFWANNRWGGHWNHFHPWHRWYGGVFWPYFFGDYFCWGFWPGYCHDAYWGYGPDVMLWGAFWPNGEDYYDDASAYAAADEGDLYAPYRATARIANKQPNPSEIAESCSGFAPGVSDLPILQLEAIIDATGEQRTALDDLKAAVANASDILKKACPTEPPLTPVARLDAMEQRLQAMQEANAAVKAPFVRLYSLLTEEQKQRLEAISKPASKQQPPRAQNVNVTGLCSSQAGFTSVPADRIASTIQLTAEQQQELDKLKAASAKASDDLKNSCPASMPGTLDGRLDAAQQRVTALIGAINTVRPEVKDFYASLTDEQKAALSVQPAPQNRG